MSNNEIFKITSAESIRRETRPTDTDIVGDLTKVETLGEAQRLIIQDIRRLPMNSANWDLMNKEQKHEAMALIMEKAQPTIGDISDALFAIKGKYGLKPEATTSDSAKSQRRKNRRERRKMENGETTNNGTKERTIRGGENTMVLKMENGEIIRFKVRKKGAPKYKDSGVKRPVILLISGTKTEVDFVLNPKAAQFVEGAKASNRVGFESDGKWFIHDEDDFYKTVVALPEKPNKKDRATFEELAAGTKIEVADDKSDDAETTDETADETQEETEGTDEVTEEETEDSDASDDDSAEETE